PSADRRCPTRRRCASVYIECPPPPELYTLSLHDALPISLALGVAAVHAEQVAGEDRRLVAAGAGAHFQEQVGLVARVARHQQQGDRKSTRLNSSHVKSSYAVFCLKKKKSDMDV